MITKTVPDVEKILNEKGYDLYFKNLDMETEILESFPKPASYPFLSRFSVLAGSVEPYNYYLDSIVSTTDFLQKISNQEFKDSTFLDVIKSLDVSKSLKYMFGEGLDKSVAEIETEYENVLSLVGEAFPSMKLGNADGGKASYQ
jgi:hypothetical protein